MINVTNDGWFGETTGPYQHFHQARVRAVEEGAPLVRAANNGISGVVDPFGRVLVSLASMSVARSTAPCRKPCRYPYARFGDWLLAAILALFAVLAAGLRKKAVNQSLEVNLSRKRSVIDALRPCTYEVQSLCLWNCWLYE
ncbi:nitrilase-related carbon-nitrogen hydrolase [Bradyrhizobium sp. RDI18]|uniref:nitrilase-related carbon-nitrogen hydrolase n=1 Tax=Bradyrhizobium sp. RDI18 TaxID=3367400 RepID=UPI00371DF02C